MIIQTTLTMYFMPTHAIITWMSKTSWSCKSLLQKKSMRLSNPSTKTRTSIHNCLTWECQKTRLRQVAGRRTTSCCSCQSDAYYQSVNVDVSDGTRGASSRLIASARQIWSFLSRYHSNCTKPVSYPVSRSCTNQPTWGSVLHWQKQSCCSNFLSC